MAANDGNQTNGKGSSFDAGGISALGPVNGLTVEAGNGQANQVVLEGAAAGSPPQIIAQGSDANIGISLVHKGTGPITVPNLTATGVVTFTGSTNTSGIFDSVQVQTTGNFLDNEVVESLATVGNGTITAAMIQKQVVSRGGAQTGAFADTTDTATNILAAFSNTPGTFKLRVMNTTGDTQTIAGGTGVTVTGTATIAAGAWRDFLVTLGSTTVTLTSIGGGTN